MSAALASGSGGSSTISAPAFDSFPGSSFDNAEQRNLAALRLLDSMFLYSRLTVRYWSCQHLLLLVYSPFGVLLALLRILLCLPLMCLVSLIRCTPFCLPRSWHTTILRWEVLFLFGVYIKVKGAPAVDARIWVCNHISEFDAVIIRCLIDPIVFAYSMYEDMWWLKCTPIHIFQMVFVPPASRTEGNAAGRDMVNEKVKDIINNTSGTILVFPEGGLTNTPLALLQYHKHMFTLGVKMQPVALKAWSPLPLALDTGFASFVGNFFFFLFTPFQTYSVEYLPPIESGCEEDGLNYARLAMTETAHNLGMLASPFLYSDKKKWLQLKRRMQKDGFDFDFAINEESQTVHISNAQDSKGKRGGKTKVAPVVTNGSDACKETLLKYMTEQWKMEAHDFVHIVFVAPAEIAAMHS